MAKSCDKLNFTGETRQAQDLVCSSCLPGSEVLRKEDVAPREETLWLLIVSLTTAGTLGLEAAQSRVKGMRTGTAPLAEISRNKELTSWEQWGKSIQENFAKAG